MYNLLMSGNDEWWDQSPADVGRDRFLEYTHDALKERFKALTDDVIAELKSYPALFAYELSTSRSARLGWITEIKRHQSDLRVSFRIDTNYDPLEPEVIGKLLRELDIEPKLEIHRTHWAVKEVDLPTVLKKHGLFIPSQADDERTYKFSRQTVISASTMMKSLSHAEFDELILEIGLADLVAGRGRGGRQARAAALGTYAVEHMDEKTPEERSLALVIVTRAAQIDAKYPEGVLYDVSDRTRKSFWEALHTDGYQFEDGQIRKRSTNGTNG